MIKADFSDEADEEEDEDEFDFGIAGAANELEEEEDELLAARSLLVEGDEDCLLSRAELLDVRASFRWFDFRFFSVCRQSELVCN